MYPILHFRQETAVTNTELKYIDDLTRVVIFYEIMKRAFGEFHKFHMK